MRRPQEHGLISPLLEMPGAIPAADDDRDTGVPWHFGDPFAEQRTAARSAVVVDRSHREVIAVPGQERLSWLHLVLSQHVNTLPEDTGTEALVLNTQGHIDCHMMVAHHDATMWLHTDPGPRATPALPSMGDSQTLLEYLVAMQFWSQVQPRDATEEYAVLSVLGPQAQELLAELAVTGLDAPHAVAALPGGGFAHRYPFGPVFAADLLVPRDDLVTWWRRLTDAGFGKAGTLAYEALRVEALRPRVGPDTDERAIPHELGWIDVAAHVAKGCYRGQETVAKVHNVGRPPRRMVMLHLDGSVEVRPESGDPVHHGERRVGRVGSVVQHHELGPIALALLKHSAPTDAELVAGDAEQERAVAAAVDPDSIPADSGEPPGRVAARNVRQGRA